MTRPHCQGAMRPKSIATEASKIHAVQHRLAGVTAAAALHNQTKMSVFRNKMAAAVSKSAFRIHQP